MRRRTIYASMIGAALSVGVLMSRGEVRMLQPDYDFGVILEADGSKTGTMQFVNEGPDATYIRSVRPSCGCTGADFADEMLAPGDTTTVSFTYDPAGRPGPFTKTVKVYFGDKDERHIIRMHGRVIGTPATYKRNYPIEAGSLRLSERVIELRGVKPNTGRHAFIRMVNVSMDTIRPIWVNNDSMLSIDAAPEIIAPGELGTLGIFFNNKDTISGEREYTIMLRADRDTVETPILLKVRGE